MCVGGGYNWPGTLCPCYGSASAAWLHTASNLVTYRLRIGVVPAVVSFYSYPHGIEMRHTKALVFR